MSQPNRDLIPALAAVVRQLDDTIEELTGDEFAAKIDHIAWLSAGAVILAELAVEQAEAEADQKPELALKLTPFERGQLSRLAAIDGCSLPEMASRTLREALRQRVDDDLAKAKEERAS